jgi:hypothetical protein
MTTHAKEPGATPARRAADIIIFQCNGIAIERIVQDAIDLELAALRATAEQLARALEPILAGMMQDSDSRTIRVTRGQLFNGKEALNAACELKLLP